VIGKRLEHRKFGKGTVQELRHRGLELHVLFDDGLNRWVRIEDTRFLSPIPVVTSVLRAASALQSEAFRSRFMVEAFRLGIVPYGSVEAFTFGRDAEIAEIKKWLGSTDTGTLVVEGEYGSGKSHLLEYVYALALNQGYAVALAELDPNEAPPFRPKAVYRKLIQSFRYKEGTEVKDFRDFMRALGRLGKESLQSHQYLSNVVSKIGTPDESEWLWNWIEGRESYYYPVLYDHGTAANVYCNILAGLAWTARLILKLRGLVLIMDEAENVDTGWYYGYQVEKGFNLVCGLTLLASNDSRLRDEAIIGAYRPGIGTWFGRGTDLIYHGHMRARYCFRFPSFLKIALAFTPTYMVDKLEKNGTRLLSLHLHPLSEAALKQIFEHICLLYDSGYGFLERDLDISKCFEVIKGKSRAGTRSFIKGSVEILDLRRFHPGMSLEQIE